MAAPFPFSIPDGTASLELVRERGETMLVVNYAGGEPLDRLVRQPMEIGKFLRLSAALSGAICQLHGLGLIHKDKRT